MPNPILDDPQDLEDPKNYPRYWLIAGMGMAILLLANNLRDIYYPSADALLDWKVITLSVNDLILFSIYTFGTLVHMEALLRSKPAPRRMEAVKNAFFSGVLAITAYKSVQLFAALSLNSLFGAQLLSIVFFSVYCAVIAFIWYGFRQKRGFLPGILALLIWLTAGKLAYDYLIPLI